MKKETEAALADAAKKAKKTVKLATAFVPPDGWQEPKSLGVAADKLWETRQKRLVMQKEVDALQAQETALKNYLIHKLPEQDANGIAGKKCRVSAITKEFPKVEDWSLLYATLVADYNKHARKKDGQQDGAFALLQRRLGETAVKERWEAGVAVAGVGKFVFTDLSISKL